MKKKVFAIFMALVAMLSVVGVQQPSCVAASKAYYIDVSGNWGSSVDITIKNRKMTITGQISDPSTDNDGTTESTKKLTLAKNCKFYEREINETKISKKKGMKALKKGEFVCAAMKVKGNKVYSVTYHA